MTDRYLSDVMLTRRHFLRLSAAVAAVPLLAGCTPTSPTVPTAEPPKSALPAAPAPTAAAPAAAKATSAIKRGGTIMEASEWTYPTMDTHMSTMNNSFCGFDAMYNSLVRFELVDIESGEQKVVGDLAESWEQPDAQTIVFKLKQGVVFHDGSPFDSAVAAWNFKRVRDHPKAFKKNQLKVVKDIETPDKHTLILKLDAPNAAFLRNMAYAGGAQVDMVSMKAVESLGDDGFARAPVGTGPFKFKQWITDDRLIVERFPDYFEMGEDGNPLPYADEFVSRYIPDATVALVEMQAGSIHLKEQMLAKDVEVIEKDPNLVPHRLHWAGNVFFFGGFNTKDSVFTDVRLRQAALYGLDRKAMAADLGFGIAEPAYYGEWKPKSMGWDETITKYEYNPDKVKQLLTEAGYPNGIDIELLVIAREPEQTIAEYVQQMWTNVGLRTKLVVKERLAGIDDVKAFKFQSYFWRGNYNFAGVDPDTIRTRIYSGAAGNWDQLADKQIDNWMDEGVRELDPNKRHEIYKKVLGRLQDQAYRYSGYATPRIAASRKELQGLSFNFNLPSIRKAWLDV